MSTQAIADSIPRMAEPQVRKVRCWNCGKLVDDFEQDYATGEVVCMDCEEEDDV